MRRENNIYWIGSRDVGNNGNFEWVLTGDVLPLNSDLWYPYPGTAATDDCGFLAKNLARLDRNDCEALGYYICEHKLG